MANRIHQPEGPPGDRGTPPRSWQLPPSAASQHAAALAIERSRLPVADGCNMGSDVRFAVSHVPATAVQCDDPPAGRTHLANTSPRRGATSWATCRRDMTIRSSGPSGRATQKKGWMWCTTFDDTKWTPDMRIPNDKDAFGLSESPALAVYQNKLYCVYQGSGDDNRMWYASFDGTNWSDRSQITKRARKFSAHDRVQPMAACDST